MPIRATCSLWPLVLIAAACQKGGGEDRRHETSEAEHRRLEQLHSRAGEPIGIPGAAAAACPDEGPCWSSTRHESRYLRGAIEEHRRLAAEHRAASAALRQAEATACAGFSGADLDTSPFVHVDDITDVRPLQEEHLGRHLEIQIHGAIVTFRKVPGLTADYLQRLVDCHIARIVALGHDLPEMPDCPLVPRGATAKVRETRDGYDVIIRAEGYEAAGEILDRAKRLRAAREQAGGGARS